MGGQARLTPPDWPRMMRKSTAAAYLDITDAAFQRAVDSGQLPQPVEFGGTKLWSRPAIDLVCEGVAGDGPYDWRKHSNFYRGINQK